MIDKFYEYKSNKSWNLKIREHTILEREREEERRNLESFFQVYYDFDDSLHLFRFWLEFLFDFVQFQINIIKFQFVLN
jgi:hypothetical protein